MPARPVSRPEAGKTILAAAALLILATTAAGAPLQGDRFPLRQPDGTTVEVRVWGDEYYQRVESLDGFTLVRDPRTRVICYAQLAGDRSTFASTGVAVQERAPAGLGLERHLQLPAGARAARARIARERLDVEAAAILADKDRDPQPSSLGRVQGITLIVDFSDVPGTVPAAEFEEYLNLPGYTGFGNNGSVYDYFWDVSDGALEYTNFAPGAYYRASQPFTYYDDPAAPYGQRARELVREALTDLDNQGFDFSQYDANHDGYIDALNIFYAGYPQNGWAVGMWPHSGGVNWSADGVSTYRYQVTNIGASLGLATFVHENGHMICFWPDLYDYDGDSAGVGTFCLMCSTGSATNPVEPCAPLRDLAGWCTTTVLEGLQSGLEVVHGVNDVFRVSHPTNPAEYYMFENRRRSGRDQMIPDSGLAIWHVDLNGSNNDQQQTPAYHYFCTLVQADGRWDLEFDRNYGDATDLWAAPDYTEFTPDTSPPATWWDGSAAAIYVDGISAPGPSLVFNYREGLGTMAVLIDAEPGDLPAPWHLEGPNGYAEDGTGDRDLLVWDEGLYTLTWEDLPGWAAPVPAIQSGTLVDGGQPLTFAGTYSDPPFTAVASAPLADDGPAAGVSLVDVDGDGDLDIYVCNDGAANRLLVNEGGLEFVDTASGLLADPGPTRAAVWADLDGDGDQDVYLTRDGQPNLLLEQGPAGEFADIAAYGVENDGPGQAAAWTDVDNDGLLDLYLVNRGTANVLFRGFGDIGGGHFAFFPVSAAPLQGTGPGMAAAWCDFDRDGMRDVYVVNDGQANVLVRNWDGSSFEATSLMPDAGAGRAAAWGDVDGDQDLDLYLVNGGQPDRLYVNAGSYFSPASSPLLADPGAGRGVVLADLDNDGALDLYVVRQNGPDLLLFGDGTGGFAASALAIPETGPGGVSVACGDVDGDGGLDLYVGRLSEPNVLLRNTIAGRGHWLHLDLVGDAAARDAIGTRVRVVAGGASQQREVTAGGGSLAQDARRLAFGLGTATSVDSVIVRWPGGDVTVRTGIAADQVLTVTRGVTTVAPGGDVPAATRLDAPYPNPFNPSTTLVFGLSRPGPVTVAVYALDGRRVATLLREDLPAGRHAVTWQGRDDAGRPVASGAYLARLETTEGRFHQRLALIK